MSKKKVRQEQFQGAAAEYRELAEAEVQAAIWDRNAVKQYVRRNGWVRIIQDYRARREDEHYIEALKFLTLPGPNATDVGLLLNAGLLERTQNGVLNIAICDDRFASVVAGHLNSFGGVLAYSEKLLHEALSDINDPVRNNFPYDVINMDLENPLIPAENRANLRAVELIFALQKGKSFLFLLTTRPDRNASDLFLNNLRDNLEHEELFRQSYHARYGDLAPYDLCTRDYTSFTQLVLPKVIARFAPRFGYKTIEHFAGKYQRRGGAYDMICHSFEFEPLGVHDAAKKYQPRYEKLILNGIDEALNRVISARVQAMALSEYSGFIGQLIGRDPENVSAIIQANALLDHELTEEASQLVGWWRPPVAQ